MTKDILKELMRVSIVDGSLDEKVVKTIALSLKRRELKQYIKALRNWEKEQSIIIKAAKTPRDIDKKLITSLFPNKCIHYKTSPSLLLGVKIIDNDMEYELNLKSKLEKMLSYVSKRND